MTKHAIEPHVRWNTEVLGAEWDDESATWTLRVRTADGEEELLTARAIISAVGQLNRPHTPEIDGQHTFAGPSFHSARWDHSVDLSGKRVAMIGAGASGFQIAPTIAPEVDQLTVFQRTAQWMFPNPNYHEAVGPGVRWALRHLPFYGRWYRFLIFWPGCDKGLEAARVDPDYPDQQTAVSELNELTRQMFTDWITSQVGDDPDLIAKVVPDYPATGKRTLQDNGSWLGALTRDNVELVRTGIDHIEPDAVVTHGGSAMPAPVRRDHPEATRQVLELVVPQPARQGEAVEQHERPRRRVAEFDEVQRGTIVGLDRVMARARRLEQVRVDRTRRFGVALEVPSSVSARHRFDGAVGAPGQGRHGSGQTECNRPPTAHRLSLITAPSFTGPPHGPPRYRRGTRDEIPHTISYAIVSSCDAHSQAVISSSPCRPISTTSSPRLTSPALGCPQSISSWSIVTRPANGRRRPPISTSPPTDERLLGTPSA